MVRTINGRKVPIGDDKPSGGGAKTFVAAVAIAGVLGAGGVGGGLGLGAGATNTAGMFLRKAPPVR